MDSLNNLFDNINLNCSVDEYDNLKELSNDVEYHVRNNIDLHLDLYTSSVGKINYLYGKINLDKSYDDNSGLNYNINLLKRLFIEFFNTVDYNKQVRLIHAIFSRIILIIDNYS